MNGSEVKKGYFGEFGGSFVPENLQAVLDRLEKEFYTYKDDPEFQREFTEYLE